MAEGESDGERTLVERWVQDQQQWQRTLLAYIDSAVKNDDFLVHLGNALRGSLLAGKPYPTPEAQGAASRETPADDRFDQLLFALHQLQGQVQDLAMTLEEIRASGNPTAAARLTTSRKRKTQKRQVRG